MSTVKDSGMATARADSPPANGYAAWQLLQIAAECQRNVDNSMCALKCCDYNFAVAQLTVALDKAVLLRADVTANSDEDRALLKRFHLFGPPGLIFFDAQGHELEGARVVGFQDATRFGQSLSGAGL